MGAELWREIRLSHAAKCQCGRYIQPRKWAMYNRDMPAGRKVLCFDCILAMREQERQARNVDGVPYTSNNWFDARITLPIGVPCIARLGPAQGDMCTVEILDARDNCVVWHGEAFAEEAAADVQRFNSPRHGGHRIWGPR